MIIFFDDIISVSSGPEGIDAISPEVVEGKDTSAPEHVEGKDTSAPEHVEGKDTSAPDDVEGTDTSTPEDTQHSADGETQQSVVPTIVNDIVVPDNSYSKYCFFFLMLLFALFVGRSFRKGV